MRYEALSQESLKPLDVGMLIWLQGESPCGNCTFKSFILRCKARRVNPGISSDQSLDVGIGNKSAGLCSDDLNGPLRERLHRAVIAELAPWRVLLGARVPQLRCSVTSVCV